MVPWHHKESERGSDGRDRGDGAADGAGETQRRRGQQEAAAVVLAQPRRELVQVPELAERDAQLEQAQVVDREQRVALAVDAWAAPSPRPRSCRRPARRSASRRSTRAVRRPARRGTCTSRWISTGSGSRFHSSTLVAKPVWSRSMSPGSTTTSSAAMISCSVARFTPCHSWPRWCARSMSTPAALHAVEGHVLEAEVVRERRVARGRRRGRRRDGPDEVDPGAVAVVVDGLLHPVAVGVELGAHVRERVPLGGVLEPEGDRVVGPDVEEARPALVHVAHEDVEEDLGVAVPCPRSARAAAGSAAGSARCRRGSRGAGSGRT